MNPNIEEQNKYFRDVRNGVLKNLGQIIIWENTLDAQAFVAKINYCFAEGFTIFEAIQITTSLVESQQKTRKK